MGCVPSGNVIVCSPFAIGKSTWVIEHNGPCSSMLPSGHHDNGRITTTSPMTDRSHGLSPGCYAPGCVAASRRASNDVRRMRKRTARRGRYGRWPMAVGFGQNLVCFPKDFVHPPIVVYVAKIWLVTLQESNVVLAGNSTIYFDDFSRTKPLFTGDHPASDVWLPEGMYQVLINYCRSTELIWYMDFPKSLRSDRYAPFLKISGTTEFCHLGTCFSPNLTHSIPSHTYDCLWILAIDVGILTILNSRELKSGWNARWIIAYEPSWRQIDRILLTSKCKAKLASHSNGWFRRKIRYSGSRPRWWEDRGTMNCRIAS